MNNPFGRTFRWRLLYAGIWVFISIIQILLWDIYLPDSADIQGRIVCDTFVCNALQAVCMLALWYPVRYYRNLPNVFLFLLYHFLFLLILLVVWLGLGFLINFCLLHAPAYLSFFMVALPVKIAFGVLFYVVFVLIYQLFLATSEIKVQKETMADAEADAALLPVEKLTRISVKKKQEIHIISVSQIIYIEANGDYVLMYTAANKYLKDRTMKYWETHLPDDQFVRIHRSFIVNIEYISGIELYEKDVYKVQLKNGSNLKASAAGYKLLRQKIAL